MDLVSYTCLYKIVGKLEECIEPLSSYLFSPLFLLTVSEKKTDHIAYYEKQGRYPGQSQLIITKTSLQGF